MVFSLLLLNLNSIPLVIGAQEESATFSWAQTNYSTSFSRIWDGASITQKYSGSYSDIFTVMNNYINSSDNTYMEERRVVNFDANYTFTSNITRTGYVNIDIDVDVYKVDVDYGRDVKLIWMALKKGYYEIDYFIEASGYSHEYFEENHQIIDKEFKKFDRDTLELLDTWNRTDEIYDTVNISYNEPLQVWEHHFQQNSTFTMPLILAFQIYQTENGEKIAWASIFSEFLVFKDGNGDGVYSVGHFDEPYYGPLNLYSGDEFWGRFTPKAYEFEESREYIFGNFTGSGRFPSSRTVDEVASSIAFTPPTLVGNDTIVWNINYRGFPIDAYIGNNEIPNEEYILSSEQSPGDFSYGFDYKIGGGQADLSLTLGTPSFMDLDTYNILEEYNLGLSIPKYNYFLSSFDIAEVQPIEITIPSDIFSFESNNETVAEINLINPVKKNYTLHDYPNNGEITLIESKGANINNLVTAHHRFIGHIATPELDFLYIIEDFTNLIPGFIVVDNLYHVHTENYPTWAGKKLVHDPTNTIYFKNITLPFQVATDLISGFEIGIIFSSLSFTVLVITLKRKKFKKN